MQPDAAAQPKKKRFGGKRLKIALIVLVVMARAGRGGRAPFAQEPNDSGKRASRRSRACDGRVARRESGESRRVGDWRFSVSLEENSGILWNVSFKLFAAVSPDAKTEFADAVGERYKARIKQAVVKVVRRSSIEDLRDPQLDLFKRNLKTEINNVLPERYVQEIIVADIRTMQQ